jgi:hypothetical protein
MEDATTAYARELFMQVLAITPKLRKTKNS